MPLIILGLILCISLLIYTMIKNKKEIDEAEDRFAERLYLLYKKLINTINNSDRSSTTFTTEEDGDANKKEAEKVLFFPSKDKNNTED